MTATKRWTLTEDEDGDLTILNDDEGPFASVWNEVAPIVCELPEIINALVNVVSLLEKWPGTENPECFEEMKRARAVLKMAAPLSKPPV